MVKILYFYEHTGESVGKEHRTFGEGSTIGPALHLERNF